MVAGRPGEGAGFVENPRPCQRRTGPDVRCGFQISAPVALRDIGACDRDAVAGTQGERKCVITFCVIAALGRRPRRLMWPGGVCADVYPKLQARIGVYL